MAVGTAAGTAVMLMIFLLLHFAASAVPFGAGVVLGGVLGCLVAAGNFLVMAVVAEKAASEENFDNAKRRLALSYRYRTLGQILFMILAIVVPGINPVAAIAPLVMPGVLIRGKGVLDYRRK